MNFRVILARECATVLLEKVKGGNGSCSIQEFICALHGKMVHIIHSALGTGTQTFSKRREKM